MRHRRRGDLPVHDVLGRGGLPGRGGCPSSRLPQLHRLRSLRRLEPQTCSGRRRRRTSWRCWPRRALLGLAESRFNQRDAAPGGVPAHRGRARSWRITGGCRVTGRPGGGGTGPVAGRGRDRHPLRRADRAVEGAARAGQGAVGLPPALRPAARLHLVGGTSSFEYTKALAGLRGRPRPVRPRCACPARCPTRRWPADSMRPTSTSRCPPTRGSGCRWSRPWWPGCPSSPGAPGAVRRHRGRRGAGLGRRRSLVRCAAALHRACRTTLRADVDRGGAPRAELSETCAGRIIDAVAAVAGPTMSGKVVFVTPRYGTAGHGRCRDGGAPAGRAPARPDGVGRPRSIRPAPSTPTRGPTSWSRATTEINGVPVHRHRVGARSRPDFYGLDGLVRLAPRLAHPGAGAALGRLQRAGLARTGRRGRGRRTPTSSPSTPTSTTPPWRPSAR